MCVCFAVYYCCWISLNTPAAAAVGLRAEVCARGGLSTPWQQQPFHIHNNRKRIPTIPQNLRVGFLSLIRLWVFRWWWWCRLKSVELVDCWFSSIFVEQVVQRIKLRPNETELLVVDDETDEYYATRGLTIKSTNPNVIRQSSSPSDPEPVRKISSSSSESESEQQIQAARLQQQQQQAYVQTNGQRRKSSSSEGEVKYLWLIE